MFECCFLRISCLHRSFCIAHCRRQGLVPQSTFRLSISASCFQDLWHQNEFPRTMCTMQTVRILKPRFYCLFIYVSSEIPGEISEGSEGLWICWHSSFKLYLSTGVRMYVVQCKSTPFQQQTNLDSCFKESTSAIHLRLFWTLSQSVTRHLCCNFMF